MIKIQLSGIEHTLPCLKLFSIVSRQKLMLSPLKQDYTFEDQLLRPELTVQKLSGHWRPDVRTSHLLSSLIFFLFSFLFYSTSANLLDEESQLPEISDFTKIAQEVSRTTGLTSRALSQGLT